MNLFAKKPASSKEVLRESKRELNNAARGVEREIAALQLEEKKLVAEIKRTAKSGNEAAAKVLARQLVRLRQQITKLQGSRAQLRGIGTHTQAMHAQASMATGMKAAAAAMGTINQQMSPAKQMKMLQEFQKQNAHLDMTSEMMSESIDNVLDDDEAEEESDELTNQVLDEIGIDVASQEKKLVAEIKRTAKSGNEAAAKVLARQLVRLRQQITKLQGSRAQLRGIGTHTQAMHAQASMATGMKAAAAAMGTINQQMSPAKQMKMLQEFQKQNAHLDMTSEMMSESIDNVLDDDEAEEESDELTNQVLDEIGIDVASQLSSAPKGKIRGKEVPDADSSELDELEKRLASLKNH